MALIGWSAGADHLKGGDGWIGWDANQRRARLHVGRRRQHAVQVEEHAVECAQVGKLGKLGCHGFSVVARV